MSSQTVHETEAEGNGFDALSLYRKELGEMDRPAAFRQALQTLASILGDDQDAEYPQKRLMQGIADFLHREIGYAEENLHAQRDKIRASLRRNRGGEIDNEILERMVVHNQRLQFQIEAWEAMFEATKAEYRELAGSPWMAPRDRAKARENAGKARSQTAALAAALQIVGARSLDELREAPQHQPDWNGTHADDDGHIE